MLKSPASAGEVPAARGDADALKSEIRALMRDFSIEQTPAEVAQRHALPPDLAAGSRVYITWISGNPFASTLRAAVRLRELGMRPVPHLAARAIAGVDTLAAMLIALHREAEVDQALLVAGSARVPLGAFESTRDALEPGLFERHGWRSLGVAGHPEGSPDIAPEALALALRDKNTYAARTPMRMHLVTQFCFDAAPVLAWERQLHRAGNTLPVHVGLAGLASLPTLIRYARSCGVGASLGMLTRQAGRLLELARAVTPGPVVTALAAARLADAACRFERLHFFPFGSFDATVAWAAAVGHGEFKLNADAHDIVVQP